MKKRLADERWSFPELDSLAHGVPTSRYSALFKTNKVFQRHRKEALRMIKKRFKDDKCVLSHKPTTNT